MSSGSPPAMPGASPILDEALRRRKEVLESESAGRKAVLLLAVSLGCLLDANHGLLIRLVASHPGPTACLAVYLVEMVVVVVGLASAATLAYRALHPHQGAGPLLLTDRQFRLLHLHPDTPGFARSPEQRVAKYPNPFSPLPGSLVNPAAASSTPSSPTTSSASPNQSATPINLSAASWLSTSGSPDSVQQIPTPTNLRRDHYAGCESPITDEVQLAEYLSDYSAWESSSINLSDRMDETGSVASQSLQYLRGGGGGGGRLDWSPQVKRSVYQLATPPAKTAAASTDSPADKAQAEVLSQRLGVDPMQLVNWNENLRIWITQTILRPLVSEIENVNSALPKHGVSDCKIGESPLERVRKVSSLPQVMQHLPTLPALLPFIEVAQDQEYLVNRLKELASTGALSRYRWNSGGSFRGQAWSEKLPTDSELLVHWLAAYMDTRLVATTRARLAEQGDTRPFTHSHFFRFGEKVEGQEKDLLALVQTQARPPHYVVQVGDKQLDVGGGRNNLLHTLLLFLHQVKHERAGMLGRVNLGLSGLNILWVLD